MKVLSLSFGSLLEQTCGICFFPHMHRRRFFIFICMSTKSVHSCLFLWNFPIQLLFPSNQGNSLCGNPPSELPKYCLENLGPLLATLSHWTWQLNTRVHQGSCTVQTLHNTTPYILGPMNSHLNVISLAQQQLICKWLGSGPSVHNSTHNQNKFCLMIETSFPGRRADPVLFSNCHYSSHWLYSGPDLETWAS